MTPKQLVQSWVEAFNHRDLDRLAALYAPSATNHQVAEAPVTGRDQIRAMFQKGFAIAEMVCVPENIFQDGEWAILEWRDPKGLRGCGFFHVVNDQIIFQRGYWDKLSFLKLHSPNQSIEPAVPTSEFTFRLTPRCARGVDFARHAYASLGSEAVTSAHLILGLLSLGDGGVANNILIKQGITFEKAEQYLAANAVFREHFHQTDKINVGLSFSQALHTAEKLANEFNHTYVGTEHLLIALLQEPLGPAAALFSSFRIDPNKIIQTIRKELDGT